MGDRAICDLPAEQRGDVSGVNSVATSPRKRKPAEEDIMDDPLLPAHISDASHLNVPAYSGAQRMGDLGTFAIDTMAAAGIVSSVKENQRELSSLKAEQDSTVQNANSLVGELTHLMTQFKQEFIAHDHRLLDNAQQSDFKLSLSENRSLNRDNAVLMGHHSSDDQIVRLQQAFSDQKRKIDQMTAAQSSTTGPYQNRVADTRVDSVAPSRSVGGNVFQNSSVPAPSNTSQNGVGNASMSQNDRFTQPGKICPVI